MEFFLKGDLFVVVLLLTIDKLFFCVFLTSVVTVFLLCLFVFVRENV
jgi:hypothetical protein